VSILVTGGTGFIGSFLTTELLEVTSDNIILFDYIINESRISEIKSNPRFKIVQGNIANWPDVISVFKNNPDIKLIYHFGSLMPPYTEEKLLDAFRINIEGSFNVFESARIFEVPKIIYSSSGAVYGPGVDLPITEKTFRDPWTMYGVGKVCSEVIGSYYHRRQNVKFTSIRFPALIGPGRTGRGLTIFANNIIQFPSQNQKAICNVEEDISIPIIYIKEAVKFLASLVERDELAEQAYNIDGVWLSAEDLTNLVKQIIPDAIIEYDPDPVLSFQLRSWSMMKSDDALVKQELEYKSLYTPEEFVNDFIKEVREKGYFQI
jgi:threonine 3-dehydrogenase